MEKRAFHKFFKTRNPFCRLYHPPLQLFFSGFSGLLFFLFQNLIEIFCRIFYLVDLLLQDLIHICNDLSCRLLRNRSSVLKGSMCCLKLRHNVL